MRKRQWIKWPRRTGRQNGGAPITPEEAVNAAYRGLLSRPPDPEGGKQYLDALNSGEMDLAQLLCHLTASPEFRARAKESFGAVPGPASVFDPDLHERLQTGMRDAQRFERIWHEVLPPAEEMVIGQADYLKVHRRRFCELASAVTTLLPEGGTICEFGVSEFSRIYKHICPESRLVTVDRPTPADYPGFTPERCRRIAGCDHHFSIDLEKRETPEWERLQAAGPYDLVLFTEILEHLLTEPAELVKDLLSLLSASGTLYLTTPNFFRRANLEILTEGKNPQPYFPGAAENWDAHYHYREYTMTELMEIMAAAGAAVMAAYHSDCWDEAEDDSGAGARGNLVVVVRQR